MPNTDTIRRDQRGDIAWITLNRPEVLNALDSATLRLLLRHLDDLSGAPEVRGVVLTGAGTRAFCAGADLEELARLTPPDAHRYLRAGHECFRRLEALDKPVVAAVAGHALGGGFELALSCHFIVASCDASFSLPEAGLGLMPGFGGTQRLLRAIRRPQALHMMLSGRRVNADEANGFGLLAEPPCSVTELGARAQSFAEALTAASPTATRLILAAIQHAGGDPEPGLDHEAALAALALASPEARDRIAAFRERRNRRSAQA